MVTTAEEAVKCIKSGDNVFIHSASAAPQILVNAMSARHAELKDVSVYQIHTEGAAPYSDPEMAGSFDVKAMFIGHNMRKSIQKGYGSYIPLFLSETPVIFTKGLVSLDVALLTVSPPDKHGYCSLGTSVDVSIFAAKYAKTVIVQVNKHMPRTHGDSFIHVRDIDYQVEEDCPLVELKYPELSEQNLAIGKSIAELIEDGSTLQMGIGAIPDAVLSCLTGHKNLGLHTEMFSDGVLPLIDKGVINGSCKKVHPGKIVATFIVATKKLYDFIDDNPLLEMRNVAYVNDIVNIRRNPKVVAINSAIEVDLTGQVCADSIGYKMHSGVGGQVDFIRGAALSEGGKPIIALPSTTIKGATKIVPFLKEGAGVVTTRFHVHYIVTEYGVANLYGKTLKERAKLMIDIAHPDHREELERVSQTIFD